jgi:hypothetical protein
LSKEQTTNPNFTQYQRGRWRWVGFILLFISTLYAQSPQRPRITGIANISLFAHDCEKSRAYYGDFLSILIEIGKELQEIDPNRCPRHR